MKIDFNTPGQADDLLSRLDLATEVKFEPANPESSQPGQILPDDFISDTPRPEESDFTPEPPAPDPAPTPQPEIKHPFSFYQKEASVLVDALDGYAKHFLPNIYRKKLFNPDEFQEARQLIEKYWNVPGGANKENFTPRERELADKMETLNTYIKEIPTPPEGKEVIIQPLAEILQEQEKTVSPYTRLVIAIGMIYGPKVLPVLA